MEKNTIYALILSVLVISLGFYIQKKLFPLPQEERSAVTESERIDQEARGTAKEVLSKTDLSAVVAVTNREEDPDYYREVSLETEVFNITFSNLGGTIKSIKLKEHFDGGEMLEMVNKNKESLTTFNIYMGDIKADPLNVYFDTRIYSQGDSMIAEFTKDMDIPSRSGTGESTPLSITKKYIFKPYDYLMELQIQFTNRNNLIIPLDNGGFAYTLGFVPQIGPKFDKIDDKKEFRRYITEIGGKKKINKMPKEKGEIEIYERINWAAISGKYFTVIGIPDATVYTTTFSNRPVDGFDEGARLFFSRPSIRSSNNVDVFKFYVGPKSPEYLKAYNDPEKNGFKMKGLNLDKVLDSRAMLGWLQEILKAMLNFFYNMVPNYGIAIILLTVVVKIVMFPLTHKSYVSSSKMSGLSPKMAEIKEKYKGNPQKLNQEIAALYKKAGVNPLGGCLPLMLQMPIFIALYGLLSSHFELRGASFISAWISDLSVADSIFNFAPTTIPVIGSDIRLLPILMIGSQIISTKIMQTPETANNAQMKMMTYMLPLIFLFFLYDAPSGLLLYWTMTNMLSIVQQIIVNKVMKKKKTA
ncbi:MAG: membrane protein insertase YidC [Spirochaetaceae bacterium]|nr:membrane protein insertase YidC [Spirochaetaceae bacterium]